jgi:UDP-N-acetyl-D-mannosaminuronate dehydrogenase
MLDANKKIINLFNVKKYVNSYFNSYLDPSTRTFSTTPFDESIGSVEIVVIATDHSKGFKTISGTVTFPETAIPGEKAYIEAYSEKTSCYGNQTIIFVV